VWLTTVSIGAPITSASLMRRPRTTGAG
jgi:hypothetical protein